ncbi:MAG: helix-turn-helix domain-containing protein [candidate division Zixibacteria bacterium]|nr:helix-turn-helix domain-containing protein [candidate division Zixibacteria bacterium]
MDYKLFGRRLRELRQGKSLTIKQLAHELKISYMHLSNIEVGYKKPSMEVVHDVAEFFGVDKEELKILAAQIPDDISEILQKHPKDAPQYLRDRYSKDKES